MIKHPTRAALVLALSFPFFPLLAQTTSPNRLQAGYYVVVAAYFAQQASYAQRYADHLNTTGYHAQYGLDPNGKLFFVYLDQYADFTTSVRQMLQVRKAGVFDKAWVRTVRDGSGGPVATVATLTKQTPSTPTETAPVAATVNTTPVVEDKKKTEPVVMAEPKTTTAETVVVENPTAKPVYVPQTLNNTQVFLSLYNATTNEIVDGEVEVVDTERAKLLTKVKGNTYLPLPNPGSKSGEISLIANVFGFRKEQHEINYRNTEADTLKPYVALVGNYYMINFGLTRIHKGDISTLYNVYFYNDAAIMLPESKYQLNSLLKLFVENPKLKVVLHGHTNGNGRGKIIYMGASKDFFTITKDVIQGSGSAKELSLARAHVIREWLVSQGISAPRVLVKGWGGSRMIHDKNSVHARKNIRVDVEVVED